MDPDIVVKIANIDFGVLENEPCCGSVMLRTGRRNEAESNAENLAEAIKKSGAKRVVVSCAGCLKTLRKDLPEMFGTELPEIVHIVELAEDLIKSGELKLKPLGEKIVVNYHDPCHMGRALGVYDSPRTILNALPDVDFLEMDTNKHAAMCCGAGGGLRSYDPQLAKKIGMDRIKSGELIGVEIITSACPFCETNLMSSADQLQNKVEVVDIVEILEKQIE